MIDQSEFFISVFPIILLLPGSYFDNNITTSFDRNRPFYLPFASIFSSVHLFSTDFRLNLSLHRSKDQNSITLLFTEDVSCAS